VYADWLQENGQPERAEFIRLQIELARSDVSEQSTLRLREAELLTQHKGDWLQPIKNRLNGAHYHFRRGFPDCVEAHAGRLADLTAGYRFDPIIREAIAHGAESSICTLGQRPVCSKVRLRARFQAAGGTDSILVDLLRESPASREPYLSQGRWLILCWAVWSGPDRLTVHQLVRHRQAHRLPIQVGIRPFNDQSEFATWCLVREKYQCPIWLVLDDSKLVREWVGLEPPDEFREGWDVA
jgi:hypothetical protein